MSVFGTWNLTVDTPMGKQSIRLTVTDEAGTVTGTATNGDDTGTLHDLVVAGEHLNAQQDVTTPFPMTIALDLTVEGDAMTGTAVAGPFPAAPVSGVRA